MNMDDFKRDYRFKSQEGDNKNFKWLVILGGAIIAILTYLFN